LLKILPHGIFSKIHYVARKLALAIFDQHSVQIAVDVPLRKVDLLLVELIGLIGTKLPVARTVLTNVAKAVLG